MLKTGINEGGCSLVRAQWHVSMLRKQQGLRWSEQRAAVILNSVVGTWAEWPPSTNSAFCMYGAALNCSSEETWNCRCCFTKQRQ